MSNIQEKHTVNQLYSFIDESFDVSDLSKYQLIFQVGVEGVFITVNELSKNKYLALEIFNFQNIFALNEVTDLWNDLSSKSKLISLKFKNVRCIVVNSTSTLVPEPLFEEGNERKYLKFNVNIEWNDFILTDTLKTIETKNIYSIPYELKAKLDSCFDSIKYSHYSSPLIESLIFQNKNQTSRKLYIHVQQNQFELVLVEGNKLLFYNTFKFFSPEDFIFYPLFVCEQLHLNPEIIEVTFLGEIEKTSDVYMLTQKYFRNIKFGNRGNEADFGFQLQTLPKHFYFLLFNNFNLNS